jgi:hypothetical protein
MAEALSLEEMRKEVMEAMVREGGCNSKIVGLAKVMDIGVEVPHNSDIWGALESCKCLLKVGECVEVRRRKIDANEGHLGIAIHEQAAKNVGAMK